MSVCSGDLGFCPYLGHSTGLLLTWDGDTVVSVECAGADHETCGYSDVCELYQRRPVGFVQHYPKSGGSAK